MWLTVPTRGTNRERIGRMFWRKDISGRCYSTAKICVNPAHRSSVIWYILFNFHNIKIRLLWHEKVHATPHCGACHEQHKCNDIWNSLCAARGNQLLVGCRCACWIGRCMAPGEVSPVTSVADSDCESWVSAKTLNSHRLDNCRFSWKYMTG